MSSLLSRSLSLRRLCTNSPGWPSYGDLLNQIFQPILSCPPTHIEEADLSCSSSWPVALSQHSTLVQCVWPCAPRRVSLSDKYSQGHPLAPSLQPVGAWQTPHNNSVLMVLLSQEVGWGAAASKNLWLGVWA